MELEEQLKAEGKTEKRSNRFSGQSYMLTKEEATIHDHIFIDEQIATLEDLKYGTGNSKYWNKVRKGLDWFKRNNASAYMVLLD